MCFQTRRVRLTLAYKSEDKICLLVRCLGLVIFRNQNNKIYLSAARRWSKNDLSKFLFSIKKWIFENLTLSKKKQSDVYL